MSASVGAEFFQEKKRIREEAHARRKAQIDKDELSRRICDVLTSRDEYQRSTTVLWYIDARSEVRTRARLPQVLASEKKIVVPYCLEGSLELFWLQSMEQLAIGMYKILEPAPELRTRSEFRVTPAEIDLVVVPGVAFDRTGARMGHGFGYYDKLLEHVRTDAVLAALAFECQLFDAIPTQEHDVAMDLIVTESAVYRGKGRAGVGG